MIKRKEIAVTLGGKPYIFSERNKSDMDFAALQEAVRAQKFSFIQKNVNDADDRLALMMAEMQKIYNNFEIGIYISGNIYETYRQVYNSFKIKNPDITLETFKTICPEAELKTVVEIITNLESTEPGNKQKSEKKKKGRG